MRPTSSPWGKIQSCERFSSCSNVYIVSTAGHGGLMMTPEDANRLKIKAFGEDFYTRSAQWSCFEEDCQIAVAVLALTLYGEIPFNKDKVKSLIFSIKTWNNEYFESLSLEEFGAVGLEVKAVVDSIQSELKQVDERRIAREKEDRMRKEKHPDLIVSAIRISQYSDLIPYLKSAPKSIKECDEHQQHRDILRALSLDAEFYDRDEESLFYKGEVVLVYTANGNTHLVRQYDSNRTPNLLSLCEKVASFH